MIISRGRRYIFVHAPKTGGTSLMLALEARAMADDIMLGDTPKAKKRRRRVEGVRAAGRLWKHSTLRDIVGLVSDEEIASFFTFTLVRNPWDRMVSYYHWLKDQRFDHPAIGLAQSKSFSEFLNHPQIQASLRAAPYTSYVTTTGGQERCDLFIRLEHLAQDLPRLEAHLGVSLGDVPHENASERGEDYKEYYTRQDAALLADICAADIARFSYKF
ncbi:sulfotransferase family 2 domain-containing protein [Aliiroseovarius marinus]|uniref:sulfotransferase family 2 domain-containing protein n=1 Tax=Aliiroseovarius marinus TaxID=2500159 RepID=UPI003D7C57EC